MVQQLLRHGASPNAVDWDGWTPIHAAAHSGHMEIIVLLVGAGAVVPPLESTKGMPGLSAVTPDQDFAANARRLTDERTARDALRVLQAFL